MGPERVWWAISVKTGIPPRMLKLRYSAREARELAVYSRRYPFDDESNLQIPLARIAAYLHNENAPQGRQKTIKDMLPFHPDNQREELDDDDVDAMLLSGNW